MRADLSKLLKKRFISALRRRCPEYIQLNNIALPANAPVFGWTARPAMSFYLVLVTWSKENKFTLEGAWSKNGRFPSAARLSFPRDVLDFGIVKDQPVGGDLRFRLPGLWTPRGDFRWEIVPTPGPEETIARFDRFVQTGKSEERSLESLRERIDATVSDAVNRIGGHWLPYCESMLTSSVA